MTTDDDGPGSVDPDLDEALARAVGSAAAGEEGRGGRPSAAQVREVLRLAGSSGARAGTKAVTSGRWLAGVTLDAARHLPVRDLEALRAHHDGLAGSLLARPLIRNASLTSGAVGATTGALASAAITTPVTWATLPVQLAVETMIVVAVEMKMVGELHEAAGYSVAGDLRRSGPLIAKAWSESRGIATSDLATLARPGGAAAATSTASSLLGRSTRDSLTEQIRRRLVGRVGRNAATLIPMMVGAVAGEELNRRATRRLGRTMARSLAISPPGR
ncbi:MAG: hypothetical protein ACR2JF_01735 [Iamia sp.]